MLHILVYQFEAFLRACGYLPAPFRGIQVSQSSTYVADLNQINAKGIPWQYLVALGAPKMSSGRNLKEQS